MYPRLWTGQSIKVQFLFDRAGGTKEGGWKNAGRDDARYNNPKSSLCRDSDRQFLNADTVSDPYQLGFWRKFYPY